jgi:hypothetical protein
MDADASVKAEVATITGLPTRTGKLTAILDPGTTPAVRKMLGVDVTSSQVSRFGNFIGQLRDLNNKLELQMISTSSAVFGEHTMTTQRANLRACRLYYVKSRIWLGRPSAQYDISRPARSLTVRCSI